jgi:hypothetical protein
MIRAYRPGRPPPLPSKICSTKQRRILQPCTLAILATSYMCDSWCLALLCILTRLYNTFVAAACSLTFPLFNLDLRSCHQLLRPQHQADSGMCPQSSKLSPWIWLRYLAVRFPGLTCLSDPFPQRWKIERKSKELQTRPNLLLSGDHC